MLDLFSRLAGALLALGFSVFGSVPAALALSSVVASLLVAPLALRAARRASHASRAAGTRPSIPLALVAAQLPISIGFFRLLRSLPATTWVPRGTALHAALATAGAPLALFGADLATSLWSAVGAGSVRTVVLLLVAGGTWIGLQELERRRRADANATAQPAPPDGSPATLTSPQVEQAMRTMQRLSPFLTASAAITLPGVLVLWFTASTLMRIVQHEVVQRVVSS